MADHTSLNTRLGSIEPKAPSTNELRGFNARLTALLIEKNENSTLDVSERRTIVEVQAGLARLIDMLEH